MAVECNAIFLPRDLKTQYSKPAKNRVPAVFIQTTCKKNIKYDRISHSMDSKDRYCSRRKSSWPNSAYFSKKFIIWKHIWSINAYLANPDGAECFFLHVVCTDAIKFQILEESIWYFLRSRGRKIALHYSDSSSFFGFQSHELADLTLKLAESPKWCIYLWYGASMVSHGSLGASGGTVAPLCSIPVV